MSGNGIFRFAAVLAVAMLMSCPDPATARQNTVVGSIGAGYDFWDRSYDAEGDERLAVDEDDGDRRDWRLGPEIELQSLGIHDSISLRYAPVLIYDDLLSTTDVDHYLSLAGERSLTRQWTVSLTDSFVLSSDPTRYDVPFFSPAQIAPPDTAEEPVQPALEGTAPDEITQNIGRRRYWTNDFSFGTTYTYAQDSDVGLGYGFRVLRNESADDEITAEYDEYDRHEFSGIWSYRFNPAWRSELDLTYVKGLYDDAEADVPPEGVDPEAVPEDLFISRDLEEYRADVGLDYTRSVSDTFPFLYSLRGTQYEDARLDIWAHQLSAGWEHAFDSRTSMRIGGGPSYVETEDLDEEWGYNAYLGFARAYQHGSISALVNKRYEPRNFTGSEDTGMTDMLEARIDLTYQFTPNLSSTLFGLYRDEEILDPQGEFYLAALGGADPLSEESVGDFSYTRDSYSLGASVRYGFWRWFVATVSYVYFDQDGDLLTDAYNDHRITFMISASKELWRQ